MNCKNCNAKLGSDYNYCMDCGAEVVNERISLKYLLSHLFVTLGWDSRFLITFRDLLIRPQVVFNKYLDGTRKLYTHPFTFFAIGATLSVIVFAFVNDDLMELSTQTSMQYSENMSIEENMSSLDDGSSTGRRTQAFMVKMMDTIYKHYFYISFLLLPIYGLIAFLCLANRTTMPSI